MASRTEGWTVGDYLNHFVKEIDLAVEDRFKEQFRKLTGELEQLDAEFLYDAHGRARGRHQPSERDAGETRIAVVACTVGEHRLEGLGNEMLVGGGVVAEIGEPIRLENRERGRDDAASCVLNAANSSQNRLRSVMAGHKRDLRLHAFERIFFVNEIGNREEKDQQWSN